MLRIFAPAIIGILLLASFALADEATYTAFDAARFLDREGDRLADRTATVREYSGADLEALGARDLAGVLRIVAGGYVAVGDAFPKRQETVFRLRGLAPTNLRVLVDGVPIEDGFRQTADLTRVPIGQVALVRVVTGPSSSRYGPSDAAGTVEILTRQVGETLSADFGTDWGSGDALLYNMWLGDTAEFFNYYGAASHDERRQFMLSENYKDSPGEAGGERANSDFRRDSYRGRAGLLFGSPFAFFVGGSYDQDEKGIPKELASHDKGFDRFNQRRRATGQVNLLSKPSDLFELRGTGYITENTTDLGSYDTLEYRTDFRQSLQRDLRYGGRLLPTFDFGKFSRLRLGLEISEDQIRLWDKYEPKARFSSRVYHASLEDDIRPWKYLGISLGVAFDRTEKDVPKPGIDTKRKQSNLFKPFDKLDDDASSPRAGLLIGPFSGADFHFSAARKTRFPTIYELANITVGNPGLAPEKATLYEAGYRHAVRDLVSWEITGFRTQIAGDIAQAFDRGRRVFAEYHNAGEMTVDGVTALVETRPFEGMFARADYTYLRSEFDANRDGEGWPDGEFYAPYHRAGLLAGYRFEFGLGASAGIVYVGDQSDAEGKMPSYSFADARIFYSYRDLLVLDLAAENLTDANYQTQRRYPMPGRFLHGGIHLKF